MNGKLISLIDERLQEINPQTYSICGISDVAEFIRGNIKRHFYIIGDYDVDGVMATSTAVKLVRWLKVLELNHTKSDIENDVEFYVPHRFSDGYGANVRIIDNVPENSVVILVDNGIVAFDAVAAAKAKGCSVIILDHHLRADTGELPEADFIIDPNAIEDQCEFTAYCGAGLAYKLAEEIQYPDLDELRSLAAFATIADVVSLTGENWLIARNLINAELNIGLKALCKVMGDEVHDEDAAGFKICPAINAAGRLLDDGASLSVKLFLSETEDEAESISAKLKQLNEERKMLVERSIMRVERKLSVAPDAKSIIVTEKIPEGIVGIVAGKLSERYHVPAIVCAELPGGIIKGSARSEGANHLKNILDGCKDLLIKYGGHKAAAGLTLKAEDYEEFVQRFDSLCIPETDTAEEENVIEIEPDEISDVIDLLKKAAPYGQDNPKVSFRLVTELNGNKKRCFAMGKYMKLVDANNMAIMCFDDVPTEEAVNAADSVEVVGYLSENIYKGKTSIQMEAKKINLIF